jgi:hypothetical protein
MLVIPKEFRAHVRGRSYPQLVVIQCGKECEWVVHANPYKGEIVLFKGWHAVSSFHELKVGDCLMFKVVVDGFKMTVYNHNNSCERGFIYRSMLILIK